MFVERASRTSASGSRVGISGVIIVAVHVAGGPGAQETHTITMNVDLGRYADGMGFRRPGTLIPNKELEVIALKDTEGRFVRTCWDEFDNIAHVVAVKMRDETTSGEGVGKLERSVWDWVEKCAWPGKYADDLEP